MSLSLLQEHIENLSGVKLKLKINNNRSTMLSVRWEPDCTKVSMHRMFLDAPTNIMQSLACYISKSDNNISKDLKAFIEDGLKKLDYSHTIDKTKLSSDGKIYNIKELYDELNKEYFDGSLDLSITWFGKETNTNRTRLTFGLYHDQLKLIKINRLLDNLNIPPYVISFVIYHEMLHHVCPAYFDQNGMHRVHTKEFKAKEKEFKYYTLAQSWIKQNQAELFAM